MEKIGREALSPDEYFLSESDFFLSDDDSDYNDAYEEAMSNPLLDRLRNPNQPNQPCRIIDILQPKPKVENLPSTTTSAILSEPVSQARFDALSKLVDDLSLSLSVQKNELAWLVANKQEMQKQIDFLHEHTSPPKPSAKVYGASNGEADVGGTGQSSSQAHRVVSTQMGDPSPVPPAIPSAQLSFRLTLSLHGPTSITET